MQVKAISTNDTQYCTFAPEDRQYIRELHTVYAFTPEIGVHLCELKPSHELHYLYTYLVYADDVSDDLRDELDTRYCFEDIGDTYMHCDARALRNAKDCGTFEDMGEAIEHLRGNCPF